MSVAPGTRLGPYEVVSLLGSGGMGEVYRARDPRLRRDVAIKILPPGTSVDPDSRTRLEREAQAAASLNHPHICTVHEVGEADGRVYIAMELVDGESLADRLARGPMPIADALRAGTQIADGLAHAHTRGVVHRDLKSANVMLTRDGRVKILDFGLAARVDGSAIAELTTRTHSAMESPMVAGTLPYMAPEQLRAAPADARSDVWSLGVVLYEMASGARPFGGRTGFELSSAILNESPAPPSSRVPPSLQSVLARCLEKDPERRYQRASEAHAALEAIAGGAPVDVPAAPVRHQGRTIAAAIAAVLVLAAAPVALIPSVRESLFGRARRPSSSIAVLPLEDLSRDAGQEYFAAGIHEGLITDLARLGVGKVIAKPSADVFKGSQKPLSEIGRELGVDTLVTGSVLRGGSRVQVSVQLVDAATGEVRWANRYDRAAGDVLALQDELVAAIAREVRAQIAPGRAPRTSSRSVNPDAHDAYLKAQFLYRTFFFADRKPLDDAIAQYERATQLDPAYAPPYAELSIALMTYPAASMMPPSAVVPRARAAALKAIELDESLPAAHAALAQVYLWNDWDWAGAARELRRARELNPDSVDMLVIAESHELLVENHADEAIATSRRIVELDPLNPFARIQTVWVALFSRRYDEAIRLAKNLREVSPGNFMAPFFLSMGYAAQRQREETKAECARVFDLLGALYNTQPLAVCIWALNAVGEKEAARPLLKRIQEPPPGIWVDPALMGNAFAGAGDLDKAFAWWQKGLEERSLNMLYVRASPAFDPARGDPRFQAIERRLNFPR